LYTHSLMFTYDCYTQTGINAAINLNDQWSILFGIHAGDDIAPWNGAAHPTAMAMARWVSASNNDSLYDGWTAGVTHRFNELVSVRPEVRYEHAFSARPWDNGQRKDQFMFAIDALLRF
jgi:hypothetical protein